MAPIQAGIRREVGYATDEPSVLHRAKIKDFSPINSGIILFRLNSGVNLNVSHLSEYLVCSPSAPPLSYCHCNHCFVHLGLIKRSLTCG